MFRKIWPLKGRNINIFEGRGSRQIIHAYILQPPDFLPISTQKKMNGTKKVVLNIVLYLHMCKKVRILVVVTPKSKSIIFS